MTPKEAIEKGCAILGPVLVPHGFTCVLGASGASSGGSFAQATYARGDRKLELHFRHSLGLVTYHVGQLSLAHEAYMEALLGQRGASHYPGFSDDPLDGFRHLRQDLEAYCGDFIEGPGDQFRACVKKAKGLQSVRGFQRLARKEDG